MHKVLFVCLGNICRSPSAEGVFTTMVASRNLTDLFHIDSAGTAAYHTGEMADSRMRSHASRRGYDLTSRARQINNSDLEEFDYILCMDKSNLRNVQALSAAHKYSQKIKLMTDYSKVLSYTEVPDPYYGGAQGFELVLDILEDACDGLLHEIIGE